MKAIAFFIFFVILVGCENQETILQAEKPHNVTWELIAISNANQEWEAVTPEQRHYLTFSVDSAVTYSDATQTCSGKYFFGHPEYSIPNNRLTLLVPCMVNAPQLWWEYMIEEKTVNEVVAYPRLNPTAYMSYQRYKYKVINPSTDEQLLP